MNKREAKREICGVAASLLQHHLDLGGAPIGASERDAVLLDAAAKDLMDELDRRAGHG